MFRVEAHERQQLVDSGMNPGLGPGFQRRNERHVALDSVMGKEADVLNDVADPAAKANRIPIRRSFSFDEDIAGRRLDQAIDQFQCRGLSRTASPEKHHSVAGFNIERHVFDERPAVNRISHVAKLNDCAHPVECTTRLYGIILSMLSWIEIDGARLRANISTFKKLIGSDMMVVVKANAYGHGLEVVTPVIAEGADWLGVNCVDEALAITRLGVEKPIAILGHTSSDQIEDVVRNGYRQGLYRLDVAKDLSEWAAKLKASAKVHLKIETGTNRQGVGASDIEGFVRAVQKMPGLEIEGVYTHFANIEDTLDPSFARSQSRKFQEALSALDRAGVRPQHVHASATAGAVLYPELSFTMSRIGIGNYVGYGLTYQATRPMQLVVLPVGYYDGYDRKLSNAGRALIRGRAVPVIGRVAMNMTMLDVTDVGAQLDDEVVLLGRQGDAEIRAEDLAEKIGSIPYEVLARLNPLIPRILKGN